jgi:hypothetical protein
LKGDSVVFVAFGFAFGTIGGFVPDGVATAFIILSGLGAAVFRMNQRVTFITHFSISPPSSFIIC